MLQKTRDEVTALIDQAVEQLRQDIQIAQASEALRIDSRFSEGVAATNRVVGGVNALGAEASRVVLEVGKDIGLLSAAFINLFGFNPLDEAELREATTAGPLACLMNAEVNRREHERIELEQLRVDNQVKSDAIAALQDELAVLRNPGDAPVAPTYTDSKGRTHRLADMPIRYLVNVLELLAQHGLDTSTARASRGTGLATAIRDELQLRSDEAAFAAGLRR